MGNRANPGLARRLQCGDAMRHHLLFALGCLVCGCADSAAATEPASPEHARYESGWRLRAHVWKSGETDVFIDWSDQALGSTCAFARLDDGSTRCVPTAVAGGAMFFDSACTERAAHLGAEPASRYLTEIAAACAGEWPTVSVLELGDEQGAPVPVYRREGGACIASDWPGGHVYAAKVASPSTFARAKVATESHGAFDVEVLTSEDGAHQIGRVIDRARGLACTPSASSDLVGARCLPTNLGWRADTTFVDAGCSVPGVWGRSDGPLCAAPTVATTQTKPDAPAALFEVGPVAEMHFVDGAACVGQSQPTPEPFYQIGRALDVAEFPGMLAAELGDGRLRAPIVSAPGDDRPLAAYGDWGTFWDAELATYCDPEDFTDGVSRCVDPLGMDYTAGFLSFADAGCTQPVLHGDGRITAPRYATARYTPDEINKAIKHVGLVARKVELPTSEALIWEIEHVRRVVGKFEGSTIYAIANDGTCQASPDESVQDTWVLGGELAFDDAFERVSESLE
jgi:hypothetical protein